MMTTTEKEQMTQGTTARLIRRAWREVEGKWCEDCNQPDCGVVACPDDCGERHIHFYEIEWLDGPRAGQRDWVRRCVLRAVGLQDKDTAPPATWAS